MTSDVATRPTQVWKRHKSLFMLMVDIVNVYLDMSHWTPLSVFQLHIQLFTRVRCKRWRASPAPSENSSSHNALCHTFPMEDLSASQSEPELFEGQEVRGASVGETWTVSDRQRYKSGLAGG